MAVVVVKWTFGDRLRKIRRTVGASSRDFAQALGTTNSSLAQWETDRNLPKNPKQLAAQVEELTGVPAKWLLTGCCPEGGVPVPDSSPLAAAAAGAAAAQVPSTEGDPGAAVAG